MPLWVAVAIAAAAFALRAVLRGPSFDRGDAIVLGLFVIVLVITAVGRRWVASAERRDSGDAEHLAATHSGETDAVDDEGETSDRDR